MIKPIKKEDEIKDVRGGSVFRLFIAYTLLFFIFFFVVFSPLFFEGKLFLWSTDGLSQHYPNILFSRRWYIGLIRGLLGGKFRFVQWEMTQGFGGDVFGNAFSYRLINALSVFFRGESIEKFFFLRAFFYLYFAGIAFIFFADTKTDDRFAALIGALVYTFSAYAIFFSPRHAFFIEMMIFFPMLCIGVDQIFSKGRSYILTVTVFLAAASYCYFLFIISIGAVVYGVFKFFSLEKNDRTLKTLFFLLYRAAFYYILGILLAAFALLPSIISILKSSREASSQGSQMLLWNLPYYRNFFVGQFSSREIGLYGFVSLYGISFVSFAANIGKHDQNKNVCIRQIVFYNLVFLVPLLVLAFSGFAGKTERWCFILQFWLAVSAVYGVEAFRRAGFSMTRAAKIFLFIFLALYLVGMIYLKEKIPFVSLIVVAVMLVADCLLKKYRSRKMIAIFSAFMILLVLAESGKKAVEIFNGNNSSYLSQFVDSGSLKKIGEDSLAKELKKYEEPAYRVDAVKLSGMYSGTELNYGLRNQVKGISSYYSLASNDFIDFSLGLGNADLNTPLLVYGMDQRTVLNTICSVKYLATTRSYHVPYGYTCIDNSSQKELYNGGTVAVQIFENENALPLCYAYDSYIPRSAYDSLRPNEKEQALIQGVVLNTDSTLTQTKLEFDGVPLIDTNTLLAMMSKQFDKSICEIYEDKFVIKEKTSFEIELDDSREGEIQLQLEGLSFEPISFSEQNDAWVKPGSAVVTASIDNNSNSAIILSDVNQYYFGKRDVLINLGYLSAKGTLIISFSHPGVYRFDSFSLMLEPLTVYREKVVQMKENAGYDIELSDNTVSGRIKTEQSAFVCMSIPYSDGWKLTLDGAPAQLQKANICFMAFEVGPGEHEFVLHYSSPGLISGSAASISAAILFVLLIIKRKGKRT